MSKVKKQHYVPRFYLKQWSIKNKHSQLHVYDKEKNKKYIANINNVASSNYFYDHPKISEKEQYEYIEKLKQDSNISKETIQATKEMISEQVVEKELSEIESFNALIISNIIKKLEGFKALPLSYFTKHNILTPEDILELSYFIALQYLRTEEMRIIIEQMTETLVKQLSDWNLLNIDKLENDPALMKLMGKSSLNSFVNSVKSGKFNKNSYTVEIDKNYIKVTHIQLIFQLADDLAKIIMPYKWFILVNNTSVPFYTSDSPVIKKGNLKHPLYSYGFGSKGIEIIYPIHPKYAINIFEPSFLNEKAPNLLNTNIIEISEKNVIHYNDLIVQQATSQIYSNIDNFKWAEKSVKHTPKVADKYRKRIKG